MSAAAARRLAAATTLLLGTAGALADGGQVRVSATAGPFVVSIFTAPTPLRVGAADLSVMVQSAADRSPVLDAEVEIVARAGARELRSPATRAAATNKLLYAAVVDMPVSGSWTIAATVRRGETVTVSCDVVVEPPAPAVVAYWPYFAAPALVIAVFALHQWLVARPRLS